MLYCTVLYCTVLYCTVLCCTVLYRTVLNCTVLYCTTRYCTVLYCTVLYCAVLYCTVLYFTVLCCTVPYCTVLYCTVLYCKVVSFPPRGWRVCSCARRMALVPAERSGCSCAPRILKQPNYLGQCCRHACGPPLVSAYVTSSSIALLRYSDAVTSLKSRLSLTFFLSFFFLSSGGWVKIKIKLPHFHVSDTCRVSI